VSESHECFFRGCKELVTGKYHCPRHEATLERRRAITARRNSEHAARRRALPLISASLTSSQLRRRVLEQLALSNGKAK
jgi:hypothetical protein